MASAAKSKTSTTPTGTGTPGVRDQWTEGLAYFNGSVDMAVVNGAPGTYPSPGWTRIIESAGLVIDSWVWPHPENNYIQFRIYTRDQS